MTEDEPSFQPLGNLLQRKAARRAVASARVANKIAEAADTVADRRQDPPDGYAARLLVAVNLPHSATPPGAINWSRRNNSITLNVTSGYDDNGQAIGIPYGKYPRLLMLYICTEAVRHRSQRVELGRSLSEFFEKLGLHRGGSQYRDIKAQMLRLFSATFSWSWGNERRVEREGVQPVRKVVLNWDPKRPEQGALFDSYVELGTDFFQELVSRPIPWRLEAVQAVQSSSLGLDLLLFLAWRSFWSPNAQGRYISWEQLREQLGGQYTDTKEFARECRKQIARIKAVWPDLAVTTPRGRLWVGESTPLTLATNKPPPKGNVSGTEGV